MTDTPPNIPPRPAPERRGGCATAFMVIVGIVLLLPGLCAIIFGVGNLTESHPDSTVTSLAMLGLLIGAGGVALIWSATRGLRP